MPLPSPGGTKIGKTTFPNVLLKKYQNTRRLFITSEVSTDTNDVFKSGLIRHMDRISSITISVKDEPVLFTFLEDGGFMIEGNTFIDLMFRDPEKTKDRLVSYVPDAIVDVDDADGADENDEIGKAKDGEADE